MASKNHKCAVCGQQFEYSEDRDAHQRNCGLVGVDKFTEDN